MALNEMSFFIFIDLLYNIFQLSYASVLQFYEFNLVTNHKNQTLFYATKVCCFVQVLYRCVLNFKLIHTDNGHSSLNCGRGGGVKAPARYPRGSKPFITRFGQCFWFGVKVVERTRQSYAVSQVLQKNNTFTDLTITNRVSYNLVNF